MLITHGDSKIGRQELLALPSPDSTATHTVVPHSKIVEKTIEALAYRKVSVIAEEYAVTKDGARMFGVLTLDIDGQGLNLALGLRNSWDKSFAIGMVAGFRVFVCSNLAFKGEFFAIAKRHSKNVLSSLDDTIAIGVDRIQRAFQPMLDQVNVWQNHSLSDTQAKALIYDAFVEDRIDAPKHLMKSVHRAYFEPELDAFKPRTLWSLQNGFTTAFKELEPIPMIRATSSLGTYFEALRA